jgi:hypothetical protein
VGCLDTVYSNDERCRTGPNPKSEARNPKSRNNSQRSAARLQPMARGHSCPMPLGFERQTMLAGRGYPPVPEGQTTIAQRFNAGWAQPQESVPKGRLTAADSAVPSGLGRFDHNPSVETLGYSQPSLRDKVAEILVASDILVCSYGRMRHSSEDFSTWQPALPCCGRDCPRAEAVRDLRSDCGRIGPLRCAGVAAHPIPAFSDFGFRPSFGFRNSDFRAATGVQSRPVSASRQLQPGFRETEVNKAGAGIRRVVRQQLIHPGRGGFVLAEQ